MSTPTPLDPVEEHQTSAVFQPFPPSLLQRLNPSPPQPYLSPLPSESDISQSRYSDAASTSSSTSSSTSTSHPSTSTSDHHRFALWRSRQVDFPAPPTPLHHDRIQPDNLDHAHLSHSTPLFIHRPARQTPFPKPRPIERDTPSPKRGIGRAVWRLFSRRRRSRSDPVTVVPRSSPNEMAHADRLLSARDNHELGACGLRHDSLSPMRPRVDKDNEAMSSAPGRHRLRTRGKERGRGRGKKVRTDSGLPDVVTRAVGAGRHAGKRDAKRNVVWKESSSMTNLSVSPNRKERDRAGVYGEKEATSFGGYRRIVKFGEGSSVSSCEERDEEADINHLYLSRRQLRAMQYK